MDQAQLSWIASFIWGIADDVPVPPFVEQAQIAAFLTAASAKLAQGVECPSKQVELGHELRTRLIPEVVTGKLDVREAAMRLADEIEKAESLEDSSGAARAWHESGNAPGIVYEGAES